jgi:hypothetical protein
MQLTFSNLAVLESAKAAAFSSPSLFRDIVTMFLPLLLLSADSEESAKDAEPPTVPCNEAIGGVDVLTLRTDTARGRWS